MAARKEFGDKETFRYDRYTVSLTHPDGVAAMLSGISEINLHFTSPPFVARERDHARAGGDGAHDFARRFGALHDPPHRGKAWSFGRRGVACDQKIARRPADHRHRRRTRSIRKRHQEEGRLSYFTTGGGKRGPHDSDLPPSLLSRRRERPSW